MTNVDKRAATPKEVKAIVTGILNEANVSSVPVNVEKIAKARGAQIRFSPLDEELSGLVYIKDNISIIGVNALHHPNRQRFTIAHELGHLIMHEDYLRNTNQVHIDKQFVVLMRNGVSALGVDKKEVEANLFAAALLMPENFLLQDIGESGIEMDDDDAIEKLSKKYKVSKQAILLRLQALSETEN